jgi:hypothetical protein
MSLLHRSDRPPRTRVSAVGPLDAALMIHLSSVGGHAPHDALVAWATSHGWDPEDLDRCLVRGSHGGALNVELGEPPCTATRHVALSRRF